MNDIKHWLDEASDADEFERAILRSGLDADPPQGKQAEVWAAMAGALGVPPLLAASSAPSAASVLKPVAATAKMGGSAATKLSLILGGMVKGLVLGIAVYGVGAGVSVLAERGRVREMTPVVVAPRVRQAPLGVAIRAPGGMAAEPAVTGALPPAAAPPSRFPATHSNAPAEVAAASPSASLAAPSSEPRAVAAFGDAGLAPSTARKIHESQLKAEASALRDARSDLRAGRLANAFARLEASQRQFSVPELYQEREALLIELLSRSGQTAAASERAKAFLARFPESPHAAQLQPFVSPR